MMDVPKAKVVRISGLAVKNVYEIDNTKIFDDQKDLVIEE